MSKVEIVKENRTLGIIDETNGTIEISEEWQAILDGDPEAAEEAVHMADYPILKKAAAAKPKPKPKPTPKPKPKPGKPGRPY
jgi:outer membrane biosynthesis protein TonB